MTENKDCLVKEITDAYAAGLLRYKYFPYAIQLDFDAKVSGKTLQKLYCHIKTKYYSSINKVVYNGASSIFIYM